MKSLQFSRSDRGNSIIGAVIAVVALIIGLLIGFYLIQPKADLKIPDWFLNPPQDPEYVFGTGTALSHELQLARNKACESARQEIARSLKVQISFTASEDESGTLMKSYKEQVDDIYLNQAKVDRIQAEQDQNLYRVYVLMAMPISIDTTNKEEELYTRFKASQAFDELDRYLNAQSDSSKEPSNKKNKKK